VQLLDGAPWGLDAVNSSEINVTGSTLAGDLAGQRGRGAIRFRGEGKKNHISACRIKGKIELEEVSQVAMVNNVE
jgi:hypothetical protein